MKQKTLLLIVFLVFSSSSQITAVGDICIGLQGTPFCIDTIFNPVKEFLKDEIVFGNLEGVFIDKQIQSTKQNSKNYFSFKSKTKYAALLKDAGFNILNFNNNHSNDFGIQGIISTQNALNKNKILCLTDTISKNNYKFLSFYLHSKLSCKTWTDSLDSIVRDLSRTKILVLSIHGGAEGISNVNNKCEKYLGEFRGNLYQFTHRAVDAGVDVVLCHGPHVPRDIEIYKNKLIAHSLGNFCTPFGFKINEKFGEAIILKIKLKENGDLDFYKTFKFRQVKNVGFQAE
jgi:hypothetical protein